MQTRLDRADRNAHKFLNFCQFVAFGIVQEHDQAVFVAELLEGFVEHPYFVKSLFIEDRIIAAGEALETVARQYTFVDRMQAASREAPSVVDKEVVHDAAEPRSGLVDLYEVVDFSEGLYKEFLEQVLGFGLVARQSPGEPVQPVEVRPDNALESVAMFGDDGLLQVFKAPPATR